MGVMVFGILRRLRYLWFGGRETFYLVLANDLAVCRYTVADVTACCQALFWLLVLCVVMFVNDIRTCKHSCMPLIDRCNYLWLQRYVCVAQPTVSAVQLAQRVYISLQLSTFQQLHYLQCSV